MRYYAWTILAVVIVTVIGKIAAPYFDLIDIVLLYLLPVLISSTRWGRGPSFFAAFFGVLTFDFFFVPPFHSFTVSDIRYLFSFAVFLLVALVTGTMATQLRDELEKTRQQQRRTASLYELSREVAVEDDLHQVQSTFAKTVAAMADAEVVILAPGSPGGELREVVSQPPLRDLPDDKERAVAEWVLEHGQVAGKGTDILGGREYIYFPVRANDKTLAVFAVKPNAGNALPPERVQLIEAVANLAAAAMIRMGLAKEAERARLLAESEKFHAALLNSISHDLRTPLASITGAVTSLLSEGEGFGPETRGVLLSTIKDEAGRMNRLVSNLLGMVRLESGGLKPNDQWWDIQDILGVVLRQMNDVVQDRPLRIHIPGGLPLVRADFALLEQVLTNLLENSVKYSPAGSEVSIAVRPEGGNLFITVGNQGTVIPPAEREHIFEKFYRLDSARHVSGTGLGLAICKGIIEAHGGAIWVEPGPGSGNRFTFSLPALDQSSVPIHIGQGMDHAL